MKEKGSAWIYFIQANMVYHSYPKLKNHFCLCVSIIGEPIIDTCYCALVCVCCDENSPLVIVTLPKNEDR